MEKRVNVVVVCVAICTLAMSATSSAQAQNLFEADYGSGHIYEFTPGGAQSTFASGLSGPTFLAFQIPEPSTWSMLAMGAVALLGGLRLRRRSS